VSSRCSGCWGVLLVDLVLDVGLTLSELLLGLAERTRQLGKLGAAENKQNDDQDDDQLGSAEIHGRSVPVLVSAVNISEGRRPAVLARLATAAGEALLDAHHDPYHHRSVLTVAGEDAVRAITIEGVASIDLRRHSGVHPRLGAVDVVPFVPYGDSTIDDARVARDAFVTWSGADLALPALVYGDDARSLPEVRRRARFELLPHPTAGAVCVSARLPLVAFNVWLATDDVAVARRVASEVRSPMVRALGLPVGVRVQVSMNLVDPLQFGPADAYDAVAERAEVGGTELVGLVPDAVLRSVPRERWDELDLDAGRTVEARLGGRDR